MAETLYVVELKNGKRVWQSFGPTEQTAKWSAMRVEEYTDWSNMEALGYRVVKLEAREAG